MMPNSRATLAATAKTDVSSSRPAIISTLFGLIIFFSATQLGFHFWPTSAMVYGVRVDYLSPTIYFLDILILLFLALKRFDLVSCKPNQKPMRSDLVGTLAPILLVNLLFSQNPLATLSWSLHLLLYLAFLFSATIYDLRSTISKVLPLSMLFVVTLASIQVFLGQSVGGRLHWVGERMVAVGSPGIATATFMGHTVLRAYATFGHPNVLAGWLAICLLILLRLSPAPSGSDPLRRSWPTAKMFSRLQNTIGRPGQTLLVYLTLILVSLGVLFAQSRAAGLSLFGIIIPFYLIHKLKLRAIYFVLLLIPIFYFLSTGSLTRGSDLSLNERLKLQNVSLVTTTTFPAFGSGTEASISTYPLVSPNFRFLQPDHDSFTLFLSWFGFFGAIAIFVLLRPTISNLRSLIPLLPLLLLDHYLFTSPQGLFILLLYLRCCEK